MKRRTRRALTADEQSLTPADRKAIQQFRINGQSSRYQREAAIEKAHSRAAPTKDPK